MKKKSVKIVLSIVAVMLCLYIIVVAFAPFKVNIDKNSEVAINYPFEGATTSVVLTQEESKIICEMFDSKPLVWDSGLSCGFNDRIYFTVGDGLLKAKFYPASDGCDTLRYKGKLLDLTDTEGRTMDSILSEYGVAIPCV